MKFIFRLFFTCLLLVPFFTSAQETSPYYVVIGVFNVEENAEKFITQANALNIPAAYAHHSAQDVYYVYVRATWNKDEALRTAESIGEDLKKAWVFQGSLIQKDGVAVSPQQPVEQETVPVAKTPVVEEAPVEQTPVEPEKKDEPAPPTEAVAETKKPEVAVPAGKPFVFKLTNAENGNPVTGQVHLLETDRSNQYRGYNGDEKVYVVAPNNRNGRWYVACQVVGYKLYKKYFAYNNPSQTDGVTVGAEQEFVFPILLTRVRKGDYIELDQVRFFTNSNVLTPESERELTELYNMMNENPDYQVRLHGHTNGKEPRDIVILADGQDFFSAVGAQKKGTASVKELSTLRAETVKKYLVSRGVGDSRISVKGEGGVQMIFPPQSTMAGGNDRVEVEITRH